MHLSSNFLMRFLTKHMRSGALGCASSAVVAADLYSASEEWGWSLHRGLLGGLCPGWSRGIRWYREFLCTVSLSGLSLVQLLLNRTLYFSKKVQKHICEMTSHWSMPDR